MKRQTTLFTFILLTFSILNVKADSWIDPSWSEMIDESDIIALVEYTTEGDVYAKAKARTVYKGKLETKEILISNFSNRYGPIDTMRPGDRYIVFLKHNKPSESELKYGEKQINEKTALADYYQALKEGRAYYVWSPTSGDLKVENGKVQYDLLQTSYYRKQAFYPLKEFESFLKATQLTNKSKFHKKTLDQLKKNALEEHSSRNLIMLYLTSFNTYDEIFQTIVDDQQPSLCYALAKLLGKVKTDKSRDLLVQLLDNKNSIVQGEVVRQLSSENPAFIGPILLARLNSAGENGVYPSNIMDPAMNQIDGGKIEIIRTLGNIKYKPAAESLLPLLETTDRDLFELIVNVLIQLENNDFIPYINKHLKNRTKSMIFTISEIITENDLIACKPALMEFISNHDRSTHPSYEYTISSYYGLAHFDDQETREFLLTDFENLLDSSELIESSKLNRWIREYIETFTELEFKEAKPLIYKSLFKWYGYNYDFALHPELFEIKNNIEDSVNRKVATILKDTDILEGKTLVFIHNTEEFGKNFTPDFTYITLVNLDPSEITDISYEEVWVKMKELKEKLSTELTIPIERISFRRGPYINSYDERFDKSAYFTPMNKFYDYIIELPNEDDLFFLKALQKEKFDEKQLERTIQKIEEKFIE